MVQLNFFEHLATSLFIFQVLLVVVILQFLCEFVVGCVENRDVVLLKIFLQEFGVVGLALHQVVYGAGVLGVFEFAAVVGFEVLDVAGRVAGHRFYHAVVAVDFGLEVFAVLVVDVVEALLEN
jgi:hypothetical protein